jgi:hypothetical protein
MKLRVFRVPFLIVALASMFYGVWMGLLRLGWILPLPWPNQLILHGPLMIGGFLGTLIGLERAVGLARPWAYVGPALSASGAVLLVLGPPGPSGVWLIAAASATTIAVFVAIVRRQPSLFAATMLAGAICWFVGNVEWLGRLAIYRVVFWWVGFVVLTIAGERLELNRVLRPTVATRATFVACVAVFVVGATWIGVMPDRGATVLAVALIAMAAWLGANDIARRTIRQRGLTRFMAVCLLVGYMWLGAAGILLLATGATSPGTAYDAILHAIFVGFVVSMIFGHAPIVFPAVLGVPLRYRSIFYVHLVVLHASVAMRIIGDLVDQVGRLRAWGALGNAVAIALFVIATAGSLSSKAGRASTFPTARRA